MEQQIRPETTVLVADAYGRGIGNVVLQNAYFFGRPNFAGNPDQFNKMGGKRKFNVLVPNDAAEMLTTIGWMVKKLEPRPEFPDDEIRHHIKIAVDFRFEPAHPGDVEYERGPDIWVIQGERKEKLTSKTVGILDSVRIDTMDLEIRGWEYDAEENPGQYSARLVTLVAVMRPSILGEKYGLLGNS